MTRNLLFQKENKSPNSEPTQWLFWLQFGSRNSEVRQFQYGLNAAFVEKQSLEK